MTHTITHQEKTGRFEITLGDKLAYLQYQRRDQVIEYSYVYVPVEYRGHGIAAELALYAMKYAQAQSLKVIPTCPYIRAFMHKETEYLSLLAT
jgi:uncharacterized protein